MPALAGGERQQRGDEPLHALVGVAHDVGHRAQLVAVGVGIVERDVELGAHDGQRRAQLVRRVGHEAPLALEGGLEALEHRVEGVGQLAQLVARPVERDARVERAVGDRARGGGDAADRAQRAAGHHPARGHRGQRDEQQRAAEGEQDVAQRAVVGARGPGPRRRCAPGGRRRAPRPSSVRTGLVFSGGMPGAIFTRIVGAPDFTGVSSSTATWTLPCSSRNSWRTTA